MIRKKQLLRKKQPAIKTHSSRSLQFEQLEPRLAMAVVIHEFLAGNTTGIRDAATHRHDWIELKNTGGVAQDLAGWYLTDSSANLTKFQIPNAGALTVLDPGEILLVYASGNNGEVGVVSGELHTNFQLSQEPGYLAVVQSNGTTIEHEFNLYPQQDADVSYGEGVTTGSTTVDTLVDSSTAVRIIAPTSANVSRDDHWREVAYDASAWVSGTGSVGFDRNMVEVDLLQYIDTVLTPGQMGNSNSTSVPNSSAYVRYAFNVASPEQLISLTMNLRFDDGFIAYLNGKEIARANFAEDFARPQPQWDSFAGNQLGSSSTSGNANRTTEAEDLITFDLTQFLPFLQAGSNVLAFHGVNSKSTASSGINQQDFLIEPVLTATRATGASQIGYMAGPTPGYENGVSTLGVVGDTHFSVDRGFFNAPFQVAVTTNTPGASIRYTTDGSLPSPTLGTLYTGPITISTTTTLRAIAYLSSYTSTNVDTETYIFLDDVLQQSAADVTQPYATWGHDKEDAGSESGYNLDDESDWAMDPDIVAGNETAVKNALLAIPTVSLVMDWDDLFSGTPLPGTIPAGSNVAVSPQGIYIHGTSSERGASFEYFNPDSPLDQFHVDAAVETQGHSSTLRWNSDKLSFQIKFKAPYGPNEVSYPLFVDTPGGENAASEFNTLILDAGFNYFWHHSNTTEQSDFARFVTDQVVSDLQNAASGKGAPHGKYVHLYLNGLYWGLYNLHERPDEVFAEQSYGGDKDDYYVIKHANQDVDHEYVEVEGGLAAEAAYNNLLLAARAVESSPTNLATYQAVENILDVDQFIDYMVVHYYAGNGADWAHNNWYATYNHVSADGKWRFHAWDQEHAFPTTDNGDPWTQTTDITNKDDFEAPTEIHRNLIQNEEYRLRFADRVQELMRNDGVLTNAAAQAAYQARLTEIDQAIIGESARWGDNRKPTDPYTRADFVAVSTGVINSFFPVRTSTVLGHFNSRGWIPTLAAPTFNQYGGEVVNGFDLTMANPNGSGQIYYTLDGTDPRLAGGGISATAIEYTGAIDITAGVHILARVFSNLTGTANDWSPVIDKTFVLAESFPLRIVELHYNPIGTEEVTEFIELLNYGSTTLSLDGVQITNFATPGYSFLSGQTLAAGERIVVARNPTDFTATYGSQVHLATGPGYADGNLSNSGETVTLLGPVGELLQSFSYGDSNVTGWPATPDGLGPSLEYKGSLLGTEDPLAVSPADPFDNPANWRASRAEGGSPGFDGALAGDYDGNGTVDAGDYVVWRNTLGQMGMGLPADGDNSGASANKIDEADYTFWRSHFGNTTIPVSSAASGAASAFILNSSNPAPKTASYSPDANDTIRAEPVVAPPHAISKKSFAQYFAPTAVSLPAIRDGALTPKTQMTVGSSGNQLLLVLDQAIAELDDELGAPDWTFNTDDVPSGQNEQSSAEDSLAVVFLDWQRWH